MINLKSQIQDLRCENFEGRYFVPYQTLCQLLTEHVIFEVLRSAAVPQHEIDEILNVIVQYGRRVFATLALLGYESLFSKFIQADQFQEQFPDHRLPYSEASLITIIPKTVAVDFEEKQWQFIAPIFSKKNIHRFLALNTILPFIKNKELGEGGFGTVFEIEVHPEHQNLPTKNSDIARSTGGSFVRKQIKRASGDQTYQSEQYNLVLLNRIKHPNIIELLGSYTYRDSHNFIFPKARGGDLAKLLKTGTRPPGFDSNQSFYLAICGLTSAIEAVHYFGKRGLDIERIGCHHDLKPQNILVDLGTFILADFGLSRIRPAPETSQTIFKMGGGLYLAPECLAILDEFKKLSVGRKSDIWSLGCIILEVVTYMLFGFQGVNDFFEQRKIEIRSDYTAFVFHAGNDPHPKVGEWIKKLILEGDGTVFLLLELTKRMLSMAPSERPNASEVTSICRFLTIRDIFSSIKMKFGFLTTKFEGIEAMIETVRYESWGIVTGISEPNMNDVTCNIFQFDLPFDHAVSLLKDIQAEVMNLQSWQGRQTHPVLVDLRILIDKLSDLIPESLQHRLQNKVELRVLKEADLAILQETLKLTEGSYPRHRLGILAAIRKMSELFESQSEMINNAPKFDSRQIKLRSKFGDHQLAWAFDVNGIERQNVLVEWIEYDVRWSADVGSDLFKRVRDMVSRLYSFTEATGFRNLNCSGFFHRPEKNSFGLVFILPVSHHPSSTILSLRDAIIKTSQKKDWPILGNRFAVAYAIANSIFELHKVKWYHKNLSSSNIVFATHDIDNIRTRELIKDPFLIGFNHSRPSDDEAFSKGPPKNQEMDYRHPEYKSKRRFCAEFDYYSVGILLLEIGFWQPIAKITQHTMGKTREQIKDYLIQIIVPYLGAEMGALYRDAVLACLTLDEHSLAANANANANAGSDKSYDALFEKLVLQKLVLCVV